MEFQSYFILLISAIVGYACGQTCAPNECSEASLPKPMGTGLSGYTPGGSNCYSDTTLVTYICTGSLIGPPTNQCDGGSWVFPFGPTCEVATGCSRPQLPENGNVTEYNDEYSLYDRITYNCDEGYSIIGPQEAVCDSGGIWSPSNIPTCEASCTAPSIANGGPNGTFVNGEVMTYTCDINYTLIGVSSATCRDGLWDPLSVPECLGNCLSPIVPNSNFATQQDTIDHSTSVVIDCDPGFSTGSSTSSTLTCNDGTLSGEDPTCYENCSPLATFLNGDVTGDTSPFYHTETVTFTCDPSFTLKGASNIICYDGVWSAAQPLCKEPGDCSDIEPEAYSAFYGAASPFQNGDTVTFTCYDGYELFNGSLTSTCLNGQWSSEPPFCIEQITTTQAASTLTDLSSTELLSTKLATLHDTTLPSTYQTATEAASTNVQQTSFVTMTEVLTEIQTSFVTVSTENVPPTDMSEVTATSEIMQSEQTSSAGVTMLTPTMAPMMGSSESTHTDMSTLPVTTSLSEGSTSGYITVTSQNTATDIDPMTLIDGEVTSPHSTTSLDEITTSAQMTVTSHTTVTDSGLTTLVEGEATSTRATTLLGLGSTTAQKTVTSQKSATNSGSTTLVGGDRTSFHSTTSIDDMSTTAKAAATSQNGATDNGEITSKYSTTSLDEISTSAKTAATSPDTGTDSGEITSKYSTMPLDEISTSVRITTTSQKTSTDGGSTTLFGGEVTATTEKSVSLSPTGRSSPTASSSKGITEDQKVIVIVTATAVGTVTVLAVILALISCHHARNGTSDKNTYETNGRNTKSEHAYDNNGIVLTHL